MDNNFKSLDHHWPSTSSFNPSKKWKSCEFLSEKTTLTCTENNLSSAKHSASASNTIQNQLNETIEKMFQLMTEDNNVEATNIGLSMVPSLQKCKDKTLRVRLISLLGLCFERENRHREAADFYRKAISVDGIKESEESVPIYEQYIEALTATGDYKNAAKVLMQYRSLLSHFERLHPAENAQIHKKIEGFAEKIISSLKEKVCSQETPANATQDAMIASDILQLFMWFKGDPISRGVKDILLDIYVPGIYIKEDASNFDEETIGQMSFYLEKISSSLLGSASLQNKIDMLYSFCNVSLSTASLEIEKVFSSIIQGTIYLAQSHVNKAKLTFSKAENHLKASGNSSGWYKLESTIKIRSFMCEVFEGKESESLIHLNKFVSSTMLKKTQNGKASKDKSIVEVFEVQILLLLAHQKVHECVWKCGYFYSDGGIDFLKDPLCRLLLGGLQGKVLASGHEINPVAYAAIKSITNVTRFNSLHELYWLVLSLCALRDEEKHTLVIEAIEKMRLLYGFAGTLLACEAMQLVAEYFVAGDTIESMKRLRKSIGEILMELRHEVNIYASSRRIEEKRSIVMLNMDVRENMQRENFEAAMDLMDKCFDGITMYSPLSVQLGIAETVTLWKTCACRLFME